MKEVTFQQVALGLLYHISQDDRHKSMFIYTDAVTVILDLLMRVEDLTTTPELIALAVNLTQNSRIAEVWWLCCFALVSVWVCMLLCNNARLSACAVAQCTVSMHMLHRHPFTPGIVIIITQCFPAFARCM